MTQSLLSVVGHLDALLNIADVPDDDRALNGLQVDAGAGSVTRVAAAVDACLATIEGAAAAHADLLLVHHGLFWGGLEPLTGRHGRRVRQLLASGISLYSAHNPLDLHPEFGNNAVLARDLGVRDLQPFGHWKGAHVGCGGVLAGDLDDLVQRLAARLGAAPHVIATGPRTTARVAVITGAGSATLAEARDAGYDTLITGEAPHHAFLDAEEWGINLVLGGHYATETVGVQALARHLESEFGLPWTFIDHPSGL